MAITTLTSANFKQVIASNPFVIIDFWARWCEPCISFAEQFKPAAERHGDLLFAMLDIDQAPEVADYFNIKQIPCVLAIKDQIVIDGQIGDMTASAFDHLIAQWRNFDLTEINRHFDKKVTSLVASNT